MEQHAGHVEGTVFAAHGGARNRLVRAAVIAGAALVIAWVIALALGVMGGFGSLPLLPRTHSGGSSETSSAAHHSQAAAPVARPQHQAVPIRTATSQRSGGARGTGHRATSPAPAPKVRPA